MAFAFNLPSLGDLVVLEGGFLHAKRYGLITQRDLENAITRETLIQCADDDRDGEPDFRVVARIIEDAEAYAESFLPGYYDRSDRKQTDRLYKLALVELAQSYTLRRHPEYAKTFGKDGRVDTLKKSATDMLQRIQQGTQRLPDVEASKGPKNSGVFLDSSGPRTIIDGVDGSNNNPMF